MDVCLKSYVNTMDVRVSTVVRQHSGRTCVYNRTSTQWAYVCLQSYVNSVDVRVSISIRQHHGRIYSRTSTQCTCVYSHTETLVMYGYNRLSLCSLCYGSPIETVNFC